MKKLFTMIAVCCGMVAANAQEKTAIEDSNLLWDNWYAGVQIGGVAPLKSLGDQRLAFGVEVGRYLTPVFGLAAEYNMYVNTTPSVNAIDQTNLSGLMKFNLSNLFCGYKGEPRFFEAVLNYGIGWGHNFVCNWPYYFTVYEPKDELASVTGAHFPLADNNIFAEIPGCDKHGWDMNYLTSKLGFDLNFNLGEAKAWQINVKPAIVWYMHENFYGENSSHGYKLNADFANLELMAGVTYKFGNSNGTHNFVRTALRDQNEIDGLNGQINDLMNQLNDKNAQLAAANDRIAKDAKRIKDLEDALANVKPCDPTCETIVSFACASSQIASTQVVNVERVAQYLKANENAKVSIKGYASPEGNLSYNQKLAERRANAVKNMLMKKYGIAESRITAEGCGIGNIFETPKMNRVAINVAK